MDVANQSTQLKKIIDRCFKVNLPKNQSRIYNRFRKHSKSQCRQDLIIAFINNWSSGSIIEVGSTDGVFLSNSLMLEQFFGWECILVEPCLAWKERLIANRADSQLIFDAVSDSPNLHLNFTETEFPELSGVTGSLPNDFWTNERRNSVNYEVTTTTLDIICEKYLMDKKFLVVTVDIEGGEIEALHGFERKLSLANLLVIENNGNLEKIQALDNILLNRNFVRLVWPFSTFDSWYLKKDQLGGNASFTNLLRSGVVKSIPSILIEC
jgi:FkbM family methyltransferase